MDILSYYLESQKSSAWVSKFQSTSNNQSGKTFSYINTNFRGIMAYFNQLLMFEAKDGLRRSEWLDFQLTGQEKDKHRVINLINAGFLSQVNDIYRITPKGKTLLALYRENRLFDPDKWPLVFLLLLDYRTQNRQMDIIYSAMEVYNALEDCGVSAARLLAALKEGIKSQDKDKLFRTDAFWLVSFAKDENFIKTYVEASKQEKQQLYNWVISQSKDKQSKDCIAHKFVSGGAYTTSMFIDDLMVLLSLLILLMLQDVDPQNFLELYARIFPAARFILIKDFYNRYRTEFDKTYSNTIKKINSKIGVDIMGIEKRLEDVKIALGFSLPDKSDADSIEYAWYVGATGGGTDYSDVYISEGRWENGYNDKYTDAVKSMKVGDRIVIKSAYTKKYGLPFNNHGRIVGVMGIKAIGVITDNPGDGKNISVDWQKVDPVKEWYGDGALRTTVHCVRAADSYIKKALLMFTFGDMAQDYSVFDEPEDEESAAVVEEQVEADETNEAFPDRQPREKKFSGLNTILYGAPGTGKTYLTAEYALAVIEHRQVDNGQKTAQERKQLMEKYNALVKKGQIVFTTFHQSYGYEDFIQGLRPDVAADKIKFKPVDGVFKLIADRAMKDERNDYVIIIDEINRANISKVFGELITLIEEDKRWGEVNAISVTLPSGEPFAVPNNLYIIGTMNSADKSISLIDTALRRRFEFVEVTPQLDMVADSTLKTVLERLNKGLVNELHSTDLLIGHAYFIDKTQADLCDIMNRSIIPLLYEYFYDNAKKVKDQVKDAVEGFDVEIEDNNVGRIRVIPKG